MIFQSVFKEKTKKKRRMVPQKLFFFSGKFGFGQSAVLLKPSADCPATMLYMNEGTPMKKNQIYSAYSIGNYITYIDWEIKPSGSIYLIGAIILHILNR